jgi:hypothetical protein
VLPPVDSVTGFQVTPVVGIIPPGLQYHASVDEVSAVFEMPLEEALRLGAIIRWIFSRGMTIGSGCPGISIILSGA